MVSLTEVKELLRIPYDDEDSYIQAIIDADTSILRTLWKTITSSTKVMKAFQGLQTTL